MNIFAIIILAALMLEFLLEMTADRLNLKALDAALPEDLKDVYEPDQYRRSQEYIRVKTRLNTAGSVFSLTVLLVFWFCEGFNWYDRIVRSWNFDPLVNGLLYIGTLLLVSALLRQPFSLYSTFVIEKQFGFNRTTPRTYGLDLLKGFILALVLGGLLLSGILALFQFVGVNAWLYCWLALIVVSLGMQYVAPVWIMPLFNKFTPMKDGDLKTAILNYTANVRFPIRNILVMDGSKRSSKSNAFFSGFGRNKRIALYDTLINQHSAAELVAVIAHEIGHYKHKHIIQGFLISILHSGFLLFLLSLFLNSDGLFRAFYMEQGSVYAGLIFFALLYTPLETGLSILMQILSRRHEYAADRFAAQTLADPGALITALKKLASSNLSNLTPHPFYVFLNYSHPPLGPRIRAIQTVIKNSNPPDIQ